MNFTAPFESRVNSFYNRFFLNFLLALIIFFYAELGRLLGIQELPLAISVVWPATGFSLAALLIFGNGLWPGVFFGNLVYNLLHLFLTDNAFFAPLVTAIIVSTGSLLQALVGSYLLRRLSSPNYFATVRDVVIFLIFGGLLPCLIAPTIGVTSLYLYGSVTTSALFATWCTFIVGDLMGVYIFTPLLVIWLLFKPPLNSLKKHSYEALGMFISFILLSIGVFVIDFSLSQFFIILSIWSAYRFGMHGATLSILLISLILIIPISLTHHQGLNGSIFSGLLMNLVIFLEIMLACSLILAGLVNEREVAWLQLHGDNINLRHALARRGASLRAMSLDISNSLSLLALGITQQLYVPLKRMRGLIKQSMKSLDQLQQLLPDFKNQLTPNMVDQFQENLQIMQIDFNLMTRHEEDATLITKMLQQQVSYTVPDKMRARDLNINLLINKHLSKAVSETATNHPDFTFTVIEEFDKNVEVLLAIPEGLVRVLNILINRSIDSMKEKKSTINSPYTPILKVKTINLDNKIAIEIYDNGQGISENNLKNFQYSFLGYEGKSAEEDIQLPLALIHDMIIYVYHGELKVSSFEGEYLKVTITLPK